VNDLFSLAQSTARFERGVVKGANKVPSTLSNSILAFRRRVRYSETTSKYEVLFYGQHD
jgi:hypothetical protein